MTALAAFLSFHPRLALATVTQALGSTPREQGAWMLISPETIFGTIGGGQLEFLAIARARQALVEASPLPSLSWGGSDQRSGVGVLSDERPPPLTHKGEGGGHDSESGGQAKDATLSIPLGPEIGQCCGGRVELSIRLLNEAGRAELMRIDDAERASQPHVYLFGGGHVGHALAAALSLLPLNVTVIETRAEALDGITVATALTPMPEEFVRSAPAGSAFVVLTHDHALDFLIVAEALARTDAAYVGMIGSATKRATFSSWYLKSAGGSEGMLARLVSPIGGATADKRPAVIAALAAAEIVLALSH